MTAPPASFVRLDQEVRGPFTPDQLQALAERGLITLETEAAGSADGPWLKLRDILAGVGTSPPRPQFEFKARIFDPVNRPGGSPVDLHELIAAANRPPPTSSVPSPPPTAASNDVLEILKINRDNERQAGLDQLPVLPPRPNRRRRDYWIMLAIVNGFFAATMLLGRGYVPVVVYSLSGMVLFTAGITWILYGVMDRY